VRTEPIGLARWAGVVAGLIGFAVADLTSWFLAPAAAPLTAVGSAVIDLLPAPLVNWGKATLGTADKPVLLILILLVVLALCAVGGQLELRRRYAGAIVFGAVAAVGVAAVYSRLPGQWQTAIPTVIGLLAGYTVLNLLIARLARSVRAAAELDQSQPPSRPTQDGVASPQSSTPDLSGPVVVQRRSFLRVTVLIGAAAAAAAVAGRVLVDAAARIAEARARIQLPGPAKAAVPIPAGADLRVPGLSPYVTPNATFYRIDTALQVPVIDPEEWSLKVTGMVEREITLTYAELLARPLTEHMTTLTCVSNPVGGNLVGNATWLGLPIRDLLREAGPKAGADMVLSTSQDGWTAGTPLSALTDQSRQSLLAVAMNGQPLPVEHGFPVRMVVPGLYGYVSATKWVRELKVTTFAADEGYWTPLGWSARGPIKLASRIDVPAKATVDEGQVVVAGVAWAQHTGIAKVQVRIDDEDWEDAELAEVTGPDTWRQWLYRWTADPGSYKITVRAVDDDGEVQTDEVAAPAPDGASGWHSIRVRVREP
jgi:DMSO/TMAO reductase YedYZ molybdopterin-dependent catalytic subunit